MINAVTLLINKFSPAIPGHAISTEKNKGWSFVWSSREDYPGSILRSQSVAAQTLWQILQLQCKRGDFNYSESKWIGGICTSAKGNSSRVSGAAAKYHLLFIHLQLFVLMGLISNWICFCNAGIALPIKTVQPSFTCNWREPSWSSCWSSERNRCGVRRWASWAPPLT